MSISERPNPDELASMRGYVTRINVVQEGERDLFTFVLIEDYFVIETGRHEEWWFWIYLDVGTTVALAQLHMLRDAMVNDWEVEVDYDPYYYIPDDYTGMHPPVPPDAVYPVYSVAIRRHHDSQQSLYNVFTP